jgi:hypothetical protein
MNLTDLSAILENKGGFSYSTELGNLSGQRAYAISLPGFEEVFDKCPHREDIRSYYEDHASDLMEPGRFMGGWYHDGKYYLDICDMWSKDEYSLDQAIEFGRLRNQVSVHDLETGENHYTCDAVMTKGSFGNINSGFTLKVFNKDILLLMLTLGYIEDKLGSCSFVFPSDYEKENAGLIDSFLPNKKYIYIIKK